MQVGNCLTNVVPLTGFDTLGRRTSVPNRTRERGAAETNSQLRPSNLKPRDIWIQAGDGESEQHYPPFSRAVAGFRDHKPAPMGTEAHGTNIELETARVGKVTWMDRWIPTNGTEQPKPDLNIEGKKRSCRSLFSISIQTPEYPSRNLGRLLT